MTFEVQDTPAIVAVAKARGIATMLDNTWGSPLFFKPLSLGVDVSIVAGTKYVVGHSDAMMGVGICTAECLEPIMPPRPCNSAITPRRTIPILALRGLRTVGVRLKAREQAALKVAHWLKGRPEVERVLHPALPDCPGHEFWKRDFAGSSGLFSFILRRGFAKLAVDAMIDGLELFGIGASVGRVRESDGADKSGATAHGDEMGSMGR